MAGKNIRWRHLAEEGCEVARVGDELASFDPLGAGGSWVGPDYG